jgi:hypothetical protein
MRGTAVPAVAKPILIALRAPRAAMRRPVASNPHREPPGSPKMTKPNPLVVSSSAFLTSGVTVTQEASQAPRSAKMTSSANFVRPSTKGDFG